MPCSAAASSRAFFRSSRRSAPCRARHRAARRIVRFQGRPCRLLLALRIVSAALYPRRRHSPDRPPDFSSSTDLGDLGAALDALDHVVDGQGGHRRARSAPPSRRRSARSSAPRRQRRSSPASTSTGPSTPTNDSASGWHSGISSRGPLGRLDPGDPRGARARRPWARRRRPRARAVSGDTRTTARATARRSVAALSPTSTIRAPPGLVEVGAAARARSAHGWRPLHAARARAAPPRSGRARACSSPSRSSSIGSGSPLTIDSKNSLRSW